MKSIEWIDQLITAKQLPSDRQAALLLGMTRGALSAHRTGKATTLDDVYAYRLETELDLPHGTVMADQHAEREKDPAMRAVWQRLGKLVTAAGSGVAAGVMAITFWGLTFAPNSAQANENLFKNQLHNYTLCAILERLRRAMRQFLTYTPGSCPGVVPNGF
jgi:hypothetical protein